MKKLMLILLIFTFLYAHAATSESSTAEDYDFPRAKEGDYVQFWGGGTFELKLFTSSYDNPELIKSELDMPKQSRLIHQSSLPTASVVHQGKQHHHSA